MKLFNILTTGLLVLSAAHAEAATPNLFTCQSADKSIELAYSTTSFTGQSHLNLSIPEVGHISVLGDSQDDQHALISVQTHTTAFGNIVTVSYLDKRAADKPSDIFAFVLPGITLGQSNSASFDTVLLKGTAGAGFYVPSPFIHQNIHGVVDLHCEAAKVLF